MLKKRARTNTKNRRRPISVKGENMWNNCNNE